jgi:cobalt-zinc-cadmium efflux system membrane fusion protein
LDAARAALRVAGAPGAASEGRYVLTAPLAGTVVARDAVAGRTVPPGQILVQVADLATMWALLEVPEAEASKVRPGQPVSLRFEGLPGGDREATVNRVGASVDPATRTVRARVDLPNEDRSLKAGLFVRGRIHVSAEREAVLVPHEAVQYAEGLPVVFVRESDAVYLPVPVELGAETDGRTEILRGLEPGASVVTTGAFLLKTEILKDSIGAGCCDEGAE